jgi:TrmH family RNA methyltransferase
MRITSLQNTLIKDMVKLHQKKYRTRTRTFLVEGEHLYQEAKRAGVIERIVTTDETWEDDLIVHVSEAVYARLSQLGESSGVITLCKMKEPTVAGDRVLLLDHIQDPGNLGTLLRSALAFGFDTVVLDHTVDPYNDKVLRSTQGAIFALNLVVEELSTFLARHPDLVVYGTAMDGTPLDEVQPTSPLGLILGNEGAGVDPELLRTVDATITIPMHSMESLNVGVAGGILMHHLRRK